MVGHKIRFYGEMWLIISTFSMLSPLIWSTVKSFRLKNGGKICRVPIFLSIVLIIMLMMLFNAINSWLL